MRGEDLVGNMRLMGLGDPPDSSSSFSSLSQQVGGGARVVSRTPAVPVVQYTTAQQAAQQAAQQLAAARTALQRRAEQQAQIASANLAAKTILDAATANAARVRAEAVPVAVSAGAVQSSVSAQAAAQGASANSTNISLSIQSRAPEPQAEGWNRYIIAPRAERDLADIKREIELGLARSRQAEIDRAYAAQQQSYGPGEIVELPEDTAAPSPPPFSSMYQPGWPIPSDVPTQLPAGEIVELPDLPQTVPVVDLTRQQAYAPAYTEQDRQRIEQEFNQKFGVPVEPMFNLFWLAKTREQWAKEYQLKYGERAPETVDEMRVALLRKNELDARDAYTGRTAMEVAARLAAKDIYAAGIAPVIEGAKRAEEEKRRDERRILFEFNRKFPAPLFGLFQTQKQAYESKYGLKFPETIEEKRLALQNSALLEKRAAEVSTEMLAEREKKRRADEFKKRYDRELLERQEAREREIANKETERIAAEYAEAERREKERLDRPLIELRRESMSQEDRDAFFGNKTLQQLDKERFVEDEFNQRYVDRLEEEATDSAGIYRSELVPGIMQKYLDIAADTYDRIQAKKIAKGKIADTSKPPKFNVSQIASDEQVSNAIRKGVLKRMSPYFVTSIDHLASKNDGKFYPDAATGMLTDWVSGLIKMKGMSRSEIAKYAAKFIRTMMRDQGQSAIAHDYKAAASSGIDSNERKKRLLTFARTINAANYAIADWQPYALSEQFKESPLGVLADVIIHESPNTKKAAWAALDNARNFLGQKAKEALVGRDILQRVEVASRIRDDRSKSITQKADELLAIRAIAPDDAIAMKQGYLNAIDFAQAQARGERMIAQSAADTKKVQERIASVLEGEEDWGVLLPPPKGVIVQDPMTWPTVYAGGSAVEGGGPGSAMRGLRGLEWVS